MANESLLYLALAEAMQIDAGSDKPVAMEFYPPDPDRASVTRRLVEELDWLGDTPLIIMHPGGANNPVASNPEKQWPAERFALLGNQLARKHQARILLVGGKDETSLADDIAGMMSVAVDNWAGQTGLGEVGALCEVADSE